MKSFLNFYAKNPEPMSRDELPISSVLNAAELNACRNAPVLGGLVSTNALRAEISRVEALAPGVDFSMQAVEKRHKFAGRAGGQIERSKADIDMWERELADVRALAPLDVALRRLYREFETTLRVKSIASGVPLHKRRRADREDNVIQDVFEAENAPPPFDEQVDMDLPEAAPAGAAPAAADALSPSSLAEDFSRAEIGEPNLEVFLKLFNGITRAIRIGPNFTLQSLKLVDMIFTLDGHVLDDKSLIFG